MEGSDGKFSSRKRRSRTSTLCISCAKPSPGPHFQHGRFHIWFLILIFSNFSNAFGKEGQPPSLQFQFGVPVFSTSPALNPEDPLVSRIPTLSRKPTFPKI